MNHERERFILKQDVVASTPAVCVNVWVCFIMKLDSQVRVICMHLIRRKT